jgi:hypothetical protein
MPWHGSLASIDMCNKVQWYIRLNVAEGQGAKPAPSFFLKNLNFYLFTGLYDYFNYA